MSGLKKFITGALLICAAAAWTVVVVRPLYAEMVFTKAKNFYSGYRWTRAESEFAALVNIDPYNSEYLSAYGDLLRTLSFTRKDGLSYIDKAIDVYREAVRLNPRWSEYKVKLGQAILVKWKRSGGGAGELKEAVRLFREAVFYDPNGLNTAYTVGYAMISLWPYLTPDEKEFTLSRLKFAIEMNYWYSKFIYKKLYSQTRDFRYLVEVTPDKLENHEFLYYFLAQNHLWQFRKLQWTNLERMRQSDDPEGFARKDAESLAALAELKQKAEHDPSMSGPTVSVAAQEWHGRSFDGTRSLDGGEMYWNGTITVPVRLKEGRAAIAVNMKRQIITRAKNTRRAEFYPYVVVRLDNEIIGECYVTGDEFDQYKFNVRTGGGIKALSVEYVNDVYYEKKGTDKNLIVGDVGITYDLGD